MNRKDKIEALKRQLILHPSYLTIIEEIEKDLERLEIYEKFTIPNLRKLILKLYNNEELTREENEIIFDIMSLKNEALEDD